MSQLRVQGNASGTGIFTLVSPNSNTNQTLTLPDSTGTILTTTSPKAGNVIQVVQATPAATAVSTTGTGTSAPNITTSNSVLAFSGTITPSSTSSKILVQFVSSVDGSAATNEEFVCLFRGSSLLQTSNWYRRVTNSEPLKHALIYLDSPSSTSAVQYDIRCSTMVSETMTFNRDTANSASTGWAVNTNFILMEIAG